MRHSRSFDERLQRSKRQLHQLAGRRTLTEHFELGPSLLCDSVVSAVMAVIPIATAKILLTANGCLACRSPRSVGRLRARPVARRRIGSRGSRCGRNAAPLRLSSILPSSLRTVVIVLGPNRATGGPVRRHGRRRCPLVVRGIWQLLYRCRRFADFGTSMRRTQRRFQWAPVGRCSFFAAHNAPWPPSVAHAVISVLRRTLWRVGRADIRATDGTLSTGARCPHCVLREGVARVEGREVIFPGRDCRLIQQAGEVQSLTPLDIHGSPVEDARTERNAGVAHRRSGWSFGRARRRENWTSVHAGSGGSL